MKRKISILFITGLLVIGMFISIDAKNLSNKTAKNDLEVDFIIHNYCAYWSPAPDIPGSEYFDVEFIIKNIGDEYDGHGVLSIVTTYIYENGTTEEWPASVTANNWSKGYINFFGQGGIEETCPKNVKVEIETTLPESNIDNNKVIIDIYQGVTIEGVAYEKDSNGNLVVVPYPSLETDSDIDIETLSDIKKYDRNGNFVLTAPKNPDKGPYEYTISSTKANTKKVKTEPLDEFEYLEMDFIIEETSKSRNKFLRFFDIFPVIKSLIENIYVNR